MASQHPLLRIPELLEIILSSLPFSNLLAASQVSALWRSLAHIHSLRLRRSLFLEPPSRSTAECLVPRPPSLLQHGHTPYGSSVPCVIGGTTLAEWQGTEIATVAKVHPLLQHNVSYSEAGAGQRSIRFRPSRWELRKLLRLQQKHTQANSIMRNMFITQPPCQSISILNANATCLHPACKSYHTVSHPILVSDDRGVTIGMLMDALRLMITKSTLLCEHESSWFGGKAEMADYGLGLQIFEAANCRQAVDISGFVDEGSELVERARRLDVARLRS